LFKGRLGSMSKFSMAVLGDFHSPFHSQKAEELALEIIHKEKPDYVVQVGDLYDFYAFSKYPRSLDVMTPVDELKLGRKAAINLWKNVQQAAPRAECFQITGNHDARALKRVQERLPEVEWVVREKIEELFTFPGVRSIHSANEELFIENVCVIHGHTKFGTHAPYNQMNTVTGHTHLGGVLFFKNRQGVYWELNAGWMGDKNARAFSYKSQTALSKSTLGMGYIDEYGPRFIPFPEK
jgi:predicted phosphodiesterase